MRDYDAEIAAAEADLAFALAQGDGYAEDDAAARIEQLRQAQADAEAMEHAGDDEEGME